MLEDLFAIDLSFWNWVIFIVAGIITGIINTLAGSGSLITFPIFIFLCGLPAPVANGSIRIGAIIQSAVAVRSFQKSGTTSFEGTTWLIVPAIVGAVAGSQIAASLNEQMMNYTIGGLMVFMLLVLLVNPKRWIRESSVDQKRLRSPLSIVVFFLIGMYGGFIQAGVGIFLLAGLVLVSGYSLRAGNGVKLLIVFCFSIPALAVFFYHGQVHIGYGLAMAVCQSLGAWLAVRFVAHMPNANVWIHRLLIVIVAVAAMKFFLS
ncbi:MAG: sulfite exporter TauE/SafE family protein [Rhodothermales bacterium]